jgi:hypothetical protein
LQRQRIKEEGKNAKSEKFLVRKVHIKENNFLGKKATAMWFKWPHHSEEHRKP